MTLTVGSHWLNAWWKVQFWILRPSKSECLCLQLSAHFILRKIFGRNEYSKSDEHKIRVKGLELPEDIFPWRSAVPVSLFSIAGLHLR